MDERLFSQASCVSEPYRVLFSRPDKLRAGSQRPYWASVDTATKWAVKRGPAEQHLSSRQSVQTAPFPEASERAERDETSPGQVPKVAMKRSGDGQTFTRGHKRATTDFSGTNGAVPPKIHLPEPEFASETEAWTLHLYEVYYPLGFCRERVSQVSSFQGTMAVYRTRRLSHGRLRSHHLRTVNDYLLSTLPLLLRIPTLMHLHHLSRLLLMQHPPVNFPYLLVRPLAPPRSNLRHPLPPPKGLPEPPGPPSSSEDEAESIDIASSNPQNDVPFSANVIKTLRLPGAWAATPAPAQSQTPQPTSSSFAPARLSRPRSNSLPQIPS